MNNLDNYDTIKMIDARNLIMEVYNYNFKSRKDPLSAKLETVLKKIDHILEEYGEEEWQEQLNLMDMIKT